MLTLEKRPNTMTYDMDTFLEAVKELVRQDMRDKEMSLNYYARNYLEMPPSTLSRFLTGDRGGQGFETLFYIRDKVLYGHSRYHSKTRLKRFHNNLTQEVTELHTKFPSYNAVGRALGLSKTAVMHMTDPKSKLPQTSTILKAMRYLDTDIEKLVG